MYLSERSLTPAGTEPIEDLAGDVLDQRVSAGPAQVSGGGATAESAFRCPGFADRAEPT